MGNIAKYILLIIVGLVLGVIVTYLSLEPPTPSIVSLPTEDYYTAVQVDNIKKILIDSLEKKYQKEFSSLKRRIALSSAQPRNNCPGEAEFISSSDSNDTDYGYAYISEIDTSFVRIEDGEVTDSINVNSVFISNEPIPDNHYHFVDLKHFSTRKVKEIKIDNSTGLEIGPNLSVGYGFMNKKFDIYAGLGIKYDFDITKILGD